MPHQCLKCGKIFEEGSAQLLKGCPDCGGNRFFFTKEPLSEKERDSMIGEASQDISTAIVEIMKTQNKEVLDQSGNWVNIKPNDVRTALEQHFSGKAGKIPESKADIDFINKQEYRKTAIKKIENKAKEFDTPETIDIERPGKYKIDVKGLLEDEPIIIQKDGSYTIHLPSIFKMIDKEKDD